MIEWQSASEWAGLGLPGIPATKRGVTKAADRESWQRRERAGNGGGFEYHYSSLPPAAQAEYVLRHTPKPAPAKRTKTSSSYDQEHLWERHTQATVKCREEAQRRHDILLAVETLRGPDIGKLKAIDAVASQAGLSGDTIRGWYELVKGVERQDWRAALTPRWAGVKEPTAAMDQRARDWYLTHYLSRRQPTHAETYRRLEEIAKAEGWAIPSSRTMIRMVERDIDPRTLALAREGEEAWSRRQMRVKRDRSVFAAGEAINGDGLKFDTLWIRCPDGEIINTATAWVYQDLRTGKVLSHRLGKTENTDLFRLATYDLTAVCAPTIILIDNTSAASNKVMTAGAPRYRFKNNEHDGLGLLPALGVDVQHTKPDMIESNPGAKPIERAFGIGGIHSKVATHPRFAGRGFSKATAIDFHELQEVLVQEIKRHNAQPKRQTDACRGVLSFDEAWDEATQSIVFRKFTERQRSMLLMSREPVRIDNTGVAAIKAGQSSYGKNRYWSEATARLGKYHTGATEADKDVLLRAVANIGSDAAAIIPQSMLIEFVEASKQGGGGADIYEKLVNWLDRQVSKAVLGQTLTTEVQSGSLAAAKVHEDVRRDIMRSDAGQLAATINRDLVRPLVMLNRGRQERYPRIVIGLPSNIDMRQYADAVVALVDRGMKVEQSVVRDKLGLPEPEKDAELLTPAGAPPAIEPPPVLHAGRHACAAHAAHAADAIDDLAAEAGAEWEAVLDPMIAPLRELLGEVATLEEARDRLAGLIAKMDTAALQDMLVRAGFSARLAGRLGVPLGRDRD